MSATNGVNGAESVNEEIEEMKANTSFSRCRAENKNNVTDVLPDSEEYIQQEEITGKVTEDDNCVSSSSKEVPFSLKEHTYRPRSLRNVIFNRHQHTNSVKHDEHEYDRHHHYHHHQEEEEEEVRPSTNKCTTNSEERVLNSNNNVNDKNGIRDIRTEMPIPTPVKVTSNSMTKLTEQTCNLEDESHELSEKRNTLHLNQKQNKSRRNITHSCSGSNASSESLLSRMRATEKEFDRKVYHINHLLNSANTQITERDDVIEALQREVQRLRHQLQEASKPVAAMEHELLDTTSKLMKQVKRERRRCAKTKSDSMQSTSALTAHVAELEKQHEADEQIKRDLQRQLQIAESNAAKSEKLHTNELENARRAYETQIRTLDRHFKEMMSQNIKSANSASNLVVEQLEKENSCHRGKNVSRGKNVNRSNNFTNCKEKENWYTNPKGSDVNNISTTVAKTAVDEARAIADWQSNLAKLENAHSTELLKEQRRNATLRAENDVLRLSISRLLHLLSCLPALNEYLKWDELGHEFVFVGYPVHFFSQFVTDADSAVHEEQNDNVNMYHIAGNNHGNVKMTTGVEGGVYAGVATSGESKNVMLNGKWVEQLQDIINDENVYTKLKKIKLYEMEEAGNVVNGLPLLSPFPSELSSTQQKVKLSRVTDLMECRSAEKDYWIPFEIFTLAQSFKNKYFAKLPALTHFYPFLIKLNQIWNAKLQKRLRLCKSKNKAQELQINHNVIHSNEHLHKRYMFSPYNAADERAGTLHAKSKNNIEHVKCNEAPHKQHVIGEFASIIHEFVRFIAHEHYTLRRATRIQVSSHRYLELFAKYDEFVKHVMSYLGQLSSHMKEYDANSEQVSNNDNLLMYENKKEVNVGKRRVEHDETPKHIQRAHKTKMSNVKEVQQVQEEEESDEAEDEEITMLMATAAEKEDVIEKLLDVIEFCCTDVSSEINTLTKRVMQVSRDMQLLMQKLHTYLEHQSGNKSTVNDTLAITQNITANTANGCISRQETAGHETLADTNSNKINKVSDDKHDRESSLKIIESAIEFSNEIVDAVQLAHTKVQEITNYAMNTVETLEDKM